MPTALLLFFNNSRELRKEEREINKCLSKNMLMIMNEIKMYVRRMNGSMLLYVKEISLAIQKGLTMLLLHFIIST